MMNVLVEMQQSMKIYLVNVVLEYNMSLEWKY